MSSINSYEEHNDEMLDVIMERIEEFRMSGCSRNKLASGSSFKLLVFSVQSIGQHSLKCYIGKLWNGANTIREMTIPSSYTTSKSKIRQPKWTKKLDRCLIIDSALDQLEHIYYYYFYFYYHHYCVYYYYYYNYYQIYHYNLLVLLLSFQILLNFVVTVF